jgi:hypothetical protein
MAELTHHPARVPRTHSPSSSSPCPVPGRSEKLHGWLESTNHSTARSGRQYRCPLVVPDVLETHNVPAYRSPFHDFLEPGPGFLHGTRAACGFPSQIACSCTR